MFESLNVRFLVLDRKSFFMNIHMSFLVPSSRLFFITIPGTCINVPFLILDNRLFFIAITGTYLNAVLLRPDIRSFFIAITWMCLNAPSFILHSIGRFSRASICLSCTVQQACFHPYHSNVFECAFPRRTSFSLIRRKNVFLLSNFSFTANFLSLLHISSTIAWKKTRK